MKHIQLGLLFCIITTNFCSAMDHHSDTQTKHTPGNITTIFSKFNDRNNFEIIEFRPTYDQCLAMKNWRSAHQKFRKQWAVLRQTAEYNAYYKAGKGNRYELKTKRNATKEGALYLQAKAEALQLLALLPSIKVRDTSFKIVVPARDISLTSPSTNNGYYIAFDRLFIKYNDF